MKLTKKLENKYFVDSLHEEKILNCEEGHRLVSINVYNVSENEGIKLSELLMELYSEEIPMYLYDYQFYCEEDKYFEFQICIDEEYIKEFNELYKEFKKSAKDLLTTENEEIKEEIKEDEKALTLKNMAKKVQEVLREGIAIVYFWKNGRGWKYFEFWYEDPTNETFSSEDQIIIDSILKKDKFSIALDGYNCFGAYDLNYIQWRIKKAYEENKERILNERIEG
jgi:hypothetical protein